VATLFDADALLYPIETWAIDLHYRRQAQGLKLIKRAFDNLLMGIDFLDIDRDRHELHFRTADGIVSLTQLSEGYQNVAAWWGDLLYRMTEALGESQTPLSAHGLLLIDEIDLHLHPLWQRQLRHFLTEKLPNFQIVATTHSPLTAQQADEGELFFLSRPSPTDSPKLEPYLGIPRYLMVHQMLTSEAFGLQTIDSKHVEDLRAAYRELAAKEKRSQREEQRLKRLREALAQLPDWSIESPSERRQRELMEKISQSLSQRANHD
jgi:predicted ATP-binding protein involved in virulence